MTDAYDWTSDADHSGSAPTWAPRFELRMDEPTGAGIQRIVTSQLELAAWHARRVQRGDVHVHGVRRTTKRVRAVLRLVRDQIGEGPYRRNNVILRDVARELSDMRSVAVRIETLQSVVQWLPQAESAGRGVNADLVADAARMRSAFGEDLDLGERLARRLEAVGAAAQQWQLPDSLVPTAFGMSRTYRRGRRAMTRAYSDPSVEHFHLWRKQVKYLRHQTEVLSAAQPGSLSSMAARIEELGERLGHDHDLADLGDFVNSDCGDAVADSDAIEMLATIADVRLKIQSEILPMATHVYRPSDAEFVAEITEGWVEWHHGPCASSLDG